MKKLTFFTTALLASSLSHSYAATIMGVQSVRFTDNTPAGQMFVNEIQIFGGGTNYAAPANGGTVTATDPGTTWGDGAGAIIDGIIQLGGCCGGTMHGDIDGAGQFATISFSSPQDIDLITYYSRKDGCCFAREDDYTVSYFSGPDGSGTLLATHEVLGAGTASQGTAFNITPVPEPSGSALIALCLGAVALRRHRR